jgi:hypothetical protein
MFSAFDTHPSCRVLEADPTRLPKDFVQVLCAEVERQPLVSSEFVTSMVDHIVATSGLDALQPIFEPIFEELSTQMRATTFHDNYIAPYRALGLLARSKPLVQVVRFRDPGTDVSLTQSLFALDDLFRKLDS